jgi:hypothetical protein
LAGVAADVRDVSTVMEALSMEVNCEAVDCEEGIAAARVVICDKIHSIDLLFPDPAMPLNLEWKESGKVPYNNHLIFSSSSCMFPDAICKFFYSRPLFLDIFRIWTRKSD